MILIQLSPRLLIIGGAAMFSIMVLFIIIFILFQQKRHHKYLREKIELEAKFNQELLKTQLETQEDTFYQIGEELHDNIGQLLSSARMLLGITERSLTEVPDTLRTADQTVAKAIQDVRMLSKSLNREWLHQFNLLENLKTEVFRINTAKTVNVTLHTQVTTLPLEPQSQVMLFRILQEAIHNSIKHAEATDVEISITVSTNINISVSDNGKGFDFYENRKQGMGLMNMNHRTKLLKGKIDVSTIAGKGTNVNIQIPI